MKNQSKYFEVGYKRAIGGEGLIIAKGRNEAEALNNAKYNVFTGSDFKVIKEVEKTKDTVKGPGHNRAN